MARPATFPMFCPMCCRTSLLLQEHHCHACKDAVQGLHAMRHHSASLTANTTLSTSSSVL